MLNSLGVGVEEANNWVDTHVGSRRVNGTGSQNVEQSLPAGEGGGNDIIMLECRQGRDNGSPRGWHEEMLEDWRSG